MKVSSYSKVLFLAIFSVFALSISAQGDSTIIEKAETTTEQEAADKQPETFNPTPMIMEHIADAHHFHIVGKMHLPLPVILYNRNTGSLSVFSSNRFMNHETHEANEEVDGYRLEEGKIVREDQAKFFDFSITKNVFSMLIGATLMLLIFFSVAGAYNTRKNKAPKGLQAIVEPLVVFVRDDIAKPGLGKNYERFLPFLMTAFFFILINNLLGLIPFFPGGANVTGNIAVTMVLAVFSGILININGTKDYWKHIFWPPVPHALKVLMIPVEVIGVITKPVTLMIRLFANITAGHIVVLSLISLIFVFGNYNPSKDLVQSPMGAGFGAVVAILFTLFISVIELLVAFIQAFIFTMLSAVFIGMALEEHEAHEAHH
ncbi:MAG: F0F1 ATP synthase subunit A [Chitinophagales bacterium]